MEVVQWAERRMHRAVQMLMESVSDKENDTHRWCGDRRTEHHGPGAPAKATECIRRRLMWPLSLAIILASCWTSLIASASACERQLAMPSQTEVLSAVGHDTIIDSERRHHPLNRAQSDSRYL